MFYSLLLLLLEGTYMIAHTTPLFQVIDGDVLCASDLAYTFLFVSQRNLLPRVTYTCTTRAVESLCHIPFSRGIEELQILAFLDITQWPHIPFPGFVRR